jgi:hypothetical protein
MGPFQYVYSQREQKIRDTIKHLVEKHGIVKARIVVNQEYLAVANVNPASESAIYWNDVRWHIKQMIHALDWGQGVGL